VLAAHLPKQHVRHALGLLDACAEQAPEAAAPSTPRGARVYVISGMSA